MLEEFLAKQASEGAHDSSGSFTIRAEEARRKMAQSGLDTSQKGLLKLVQLGVDSQCRRLSVSIGKDDITLAFWEPARGLLEDRTLSEELQAALLACVYSGFVHATYQTRHVAWRLHREEIEPLSARLQEDKVQVTLRRWKPSGFWEAFRHTLSGRQEDYTTFLGHLGYCPIPLDLDGASPLTETRSLGARAFDLRLLGPRALSHSGVRTPFFDSPCEALHSELRTTRPGEDRMWETFGLVEKTRDRRHFRPELTAWAEPSGVPSTHLGLLYSPLDVLQGGLIDVVDKGVLVGRLRWPFGGHVSGVVSALGLDTDLSGLALVENSKTTDLLEYLRSEVAHSSKLLLTHPEVTTTLRWHLEELTL